MTIEKQNQKLMLMRLADFAASDVLDMSDEEIQAEAITFGDSPEKASEEVKAVIELAIAAQARQQLAVAREEIAADPKSRIQTAFNLTVTEARSLLKEIIANHQKEVKLTVAAREGKDLTDEDVFSILEDFAELGLIDKYGGKGKEG